MSNDTTTIDFDQAVSRVADLLMTAEANGYTPAEVAQAAVEQAKTARRAAAAQALYGTTKTDPQPEPEPAAPAWDYSKSTWANRAAGAR
jgi:hypothetical protein